MCIDVVRGCVANFASWFFDAADTMQSMVERGTWVALALLMSFTSGCPEPDDEGGDDEIGDESGESTDSGETDEGESGIPTTDDDLRPPDDASPDDDESESETGTDESDETDETDETDDTSASECWDLTSADGVLPIVLNEDTSELGDDQIGSCGQFPAPDFAFGFQAPFTGEFVFDTAGSSFDTVLYIDEGECGRRELGCSDDFIGLSSRLVVSMTEGEVVTVVVDGFEADELGPFTLTIDEYVPPVCGVNPILPVLPQIVLGDTSLATDQHAGGCGGQASPDDMYRFIAPGPGLYRFHTFGSAFDTVLYVWDECDGPEIACSDDANFELQSEVVVALEGGDHVWVFVDGVGGAAGLYQLNVQKL
jgi:hypothetical protein